MRGHYNILYVGLLKTFKNAKLFYDDIFQHIAALLTSTSVTIYDSENFEELRCPYLFFVYLQILLHITIFPLFSENRANVVLLFFPIFNRYFLF